MKKSQIIFLVMFLTISDMHTAPTPQDWRRCDDEIKENFTPGYRYAAQVRQNCHSVVEQFVRLLSKKNKTEIEVAELQFLEKIIASMGCSDNELLDLDGAAIPADSPMRNIEESEQEAINQRKDNCRLHLERLTELLKKNSLTDIEAQELSKSEENYQVDRCNDPKLLSLREYTNKEDRYDFKRREFCSRFLFRVLLMQNKAEKCEFIKKIEEQKVRVQAGLETIPDNEKVKFDYDVKLIEVYKQVLGDSIGAWDSNAPLTPEQVQKMNEYLRAYKYAKCEDRNLFRFNNYSKEEIEEQNADQPTSQEEQRRYDKQKSFGWLLPDEYVQKINQQLSFVQQRLDLLSAKEVLTEDERTLKSLLVQIGEVMNLDQKTSYKAYNSSDDKIPSQARLAIYDIKSIELWHFGDRLASNRRKWCIDLLKNILSLGDNFEKPLTVQELKTFEVSLRMLKNLRPVDTELFKHHRYALDENISKDITFVHMLLMKISQRISLLYSSNLSR